MSSKVKGFIDTILSRKKKEEKIELYVSSGKPKGSSQLFGSLEERVLRTVPLEKLEKLYHLDFLTFRIVNDYIESIVGPGYILEGDKETVKELEKWSEQVDLESIAEEIVRDCFLAGNAWVELGYNKEGTDIPKIRIINPKTIDYIRDKKTGYVLLDENAEPVGFKKRRAFGFDVVEWREREIKVGDKVYKVPPGQDGRDRIAHFKLWSLGESYLGLTPLESTYRQAIIRLNISRNVGESAYRSEGLIIHIGDDMMQPTNEQVDKVVEEFENIESNTIFGFKSRPKVNVERLPSPDLKGREDLLYYYADAFATGLGKPLVLLMEPTSRSESGVVENKSIDFENKIKVLQRRLSKQIKKKLFYRYMKARGMSLDSLKNVIFKSKMPSVKLAQARRIGTLARRGLIRYDPELEKRLREMEDLPTTFLDQMIEDWERTGKIPETKPEKDIRVRLEEIEDEVDLNE